MKITKVFKPVRMFEIKKTGHILAIFPDESGVHPREACDHLGTLVHWHRRYDLGDQYIDRSEAQEYIDEIKKQGAIILSVYLLDHSGLRMSTGSFDDPWDSGQVGIIYATYEKIRKEFDVKRISRKLKERVKQTLIHEIEEMDQYLCGDVYGFEVLTPNGEVVESCWGFYGHNFKENGLFDYADVSPDDLEEIDEYTFGNVPAEVVYKAM